MQKVSQFFSKPVDLAGFKWFWPPLQGYAHSARRSISVKAHRVEQSLRAVEYW